MSKHILNSSILDQQTIITLLLLLILLAPSCSWMPLLKTGPHEEPHSTYAALQDRCQAPAALASSRSVSFSLSLSLGMHAHLYLIDGSAAATTPPTAGEHKVDMEAASFTAHSIRHVQNAPLHGLVPCTD
jgi:hypothetical protein